MSKTVHLAIDALELLASRGVAMRLTEVAHELDQPKATAHRTLAALEERGYLVQLPDQRYRLGLRCLELGAASAQTLDLRAVAREELEALNRDTQENVHLAMYERGDVVYIDVVDSPLPVAPRSRVGTRAPATAVSTGRAVLAFQSPAEIDRVLAEPLVGHTPHSITDPAALRELLERVRAEGVATNTGSWRDGVCGLAAPIHDHTGVVVASVGCCVPELRFGSTRRDDLRERVVEAAARVSRQLGYRTSREDRAS